EKASPIFIGKRDNKLHYFFKGDKPNNAIFQHLYILSNEEIKEGDWCILDLGIFNKPVKVISVREDNPIFKVKIDGGIARLEKLRKIIATTDSSLNEQDRFNGKSWEKLLPRPSNEFLKKYCELGGIDEVLVEYEEDTYSTGI